MFKMRLLKIVSFATLFFFTWSCQTIPLNYTSPHGDTPDSPIRIEKVNQESTTVSEGNAKNDDDYRTNVIEKEGKKKSKTLLILGGIITLGIILCLLFLCRDDCNNDYDTKELKFEWVKVTAGDFTVGDNSNEGDTDEKPVHTVYMNDFEISKYEVTFEQYDKFCDDTKRPRPSDNNWGRDKRPVINISWSDANAFCQWLSRQCKCYRFELPTEAQWEKAARGTDQRKYPWGNNTPTCNLVNYGNCPPSTTVDVDSFPDGRSPYGVYDMAGNVWEWCKDWYDAGYYAMPGSRDPDPQGPTTGSTRVLRGGCYSSQAKNIRTTERYNRSPSTSGSHIGFRICRYKTK